MLNPLKWNAAVRLLVAALVGAVLGIAAGYSVQLLLWAVVRRSRCWRGGLLLSRFSVVLMPSSPHRFPAPWSAEVTPN